MQPCDPARVESDNLSEFARVMEVDRLPGSELHQMRRCRTPRLNLDGNQQKNGLGQLVLTLVKVLHELLERQAIRRVESGSLSSQQVERLGLALMQQSREIERLRKEFGLEEEDLNLDLGPLGRLL
ncbi:MAG: gas vesicle protein K [Acidobacteriia bacterium]|nr:gas vesicle protein K [Terriglobia bacterium]